jgi:TonB family protein
MYAPLRDEPGISLNIPWENNTARGWIISIVANLIILILANQYTIEKPTRRDVDVPRTSIVLEQINFGDGDGTGRSKGNLSAEGMAHLGDKPSSNLADAMVAGTTVKGVANPDINPEDAKRLIPVANLPSGDKNVGAAGATGTKNIGSPNGSLSGTGTGSKGYGPGAGSGLGDIEWGGGGNRSVAYKKLPTFPPGARSGQVRIKFVVDQSGNVVSLRPAIKGGDPVLERAAINAMKAWRFNPLKENKMMEGVITFTFKLS